ncbi:hypothetical protein [Sphingosinicella sp. BN140058]|uniref:hypothetical protein n=1 Tax=Sphingosinicella sp. BN140058 TaxID=1892855 RepID=UPI001011D63F|nr:hypothetical protein [Sphingosinicella sp. BN140058]QAY78460.1 hypothetical protein ETR14_19385 [Sphingosinicella sp. BN140058]
MRNSLMLSSAAALMTSAAGAQDYTGNVDPSAYSLPTVMHSAIDARAKTRKQKVSPKAAAVCADLPKTRARLGAADPRVREIDRRCRQAGLVR